eukprot:gene17833-biopygen5375
MKSRTPPPSRAHEFQKAEAEAARRWRRPRGHWWHDRAHGVRLWLCGSGGRAGPAPRTPLPCGRDSFLSHC